MQKNYIYLSLYCTHMKHANQILTIFRNQHVGGEGGEWDLVKVHRGLRLYLMC